LLSFKVARYFVVSFATLITAAKEIMYFVSPKKKLVVIEEHSSAGIADVLNVKAFLASVRVGQFFHFSCPKLEMKNKIVIGTVIKLQKLWKILENK